MSKTAKKYIFYISILVIVSAIAVFFVIKQDPKAVFDAMASCDIMWILAAIGILLLSFLVEGLILTILARMYKRNYPYYKGVLNTMIGVFFSGITPSNSGGQFAQAYTFSKQNIKITNAASILFMHFILYQIVLVLFGGAVMIFKFNEMRGLTEVIPIFGINFDIISLAFVGFAINTLVIVGLFFLAFSSKFHNFLIKYGIGLLAKLHIVKNKDEQVLKLNTKVETFRIELKKLLQNKGVLIIVSLLFLIKMILNSSIPYFISNAMGLKMAVDNEFIAFVNTTSMTNLVTTITAMIPIPGASGGAELVFRYMFGGSFFINASSNDISALILIWRGITFYLGLIIGFIVFVSYHESPKKASLHGDAKTLLEINIIHLEEEKGEVIEEKKSIMHIEPQLLTVEDIEAHFAALKNDLSHQLKQNEQTLSEQEDENKGKK